MSMSCIFVLSTYFENMTIHLNFSKKKLNCVAVIRNNYLKASYLTNVRTAFTDLDEALSGRLRSGGRLEVGAVLGRRAAARKDN